MPAFVSVFPCEVLLVAFAILRAGFKAVCVSICLILISDLEAFHLAPSRAGDEQTRYTDPVPRHEIAVPRVKTPTSQGCTINTSHTSLETRCNTTGSHFRALEMVFHSDSTTATNACPVLPSAQPTAIVRHSWYSTFYYNLIRCGTNTKERVDAN